MVGSFEQVFHGPDNFDSGTISPWVASNPSNPNHTWQATSNCPPFNGPSGPVPNCYEGTGLVWSDYVANMNSTMTVNIGNLVNYTRLMLRFHIWIDVNSSDAVYVRYLDSGTWFKAAEYSGRISTTLPLNQTASTAWMNRELSLPVATTKITIQIVTGRCESRLGGVYIDGISISGLGRERSAQVWVRALSNGTYVSAPISIDEGPSFNTSDIFLASLGTHVLHAQKSFASEGETYTFLEWSDGVRTPSRAITVSWNWEYRAIYSVSS